MNNNLGNFIKRIFISCAIILIFAESAAFATYKPGANLTVKNMQFCESKPQGYGKFTPVGEEGVKKGEDVYLYVEAHNTKSENDGRGHHIRLILDMDIYFENGQSVYSQKDVKSQERKAVREIDKTYLWVKIETTYLKGGEYKVEVNVRDKISGKSGFALDTFNLY